MLANLLPILQFFADLGLLCAIIFLIYLVNKKINSGGIHEDSLDEFRKLIEESRSSADYFFQTLDESRKSLKEIAYALDEKKKNLEFFLEKADSKFKELNSYNLDRGERYKEVMKLAKQGLSEKEIAHNLNLTEGEISLILNLSRNRNENA